MDSNYILTANGELYHWGVKGMKWGVRRYQNKDGSLTKAGKKRYDDESTRKNGISAGTKKKLAVGAAVAATAILSAYAIKNPKSREFIMNMASKTFDSAKTAVTSPKAKEFVNKVGNKTVKTLSDSASRVGKAMTDAAMLSMGTIAISKLGQKFETDENASESVKNRNKILYDTTKAGIESLVKAGSSNSSNKNGSNKGGTVGKDVSDALGAPSKKSIDKSSSEYQGLFKDSKGNQRDGNVRSTIKSLASAGYDIDQINEYLRQVDNGTIKHSYEDIKDELLYYRAIRYIDDIMT